METVNAVCIDCHAGFFYTRQFGVYGHKRKRCEKCNKERERLMTKERVRKHRKEVADQTAERPVLIVHIRSCNGKTYCGRDFDPIVAKNIAIERKEGRIDTIICKTCYRAFMADEGDKTL